MYKTKHYINMLSDKHLLAFGEQWKSIVELKKNTKQTNRPYLLFREPGPVLRHCYMYIYINEIIHLINTLLYISLS